MMVVTSRGKISSQRRDASCPQTDSPQIPSPNSSCGLPPIFLPMRYPQYPVVAALVGLSLLVPLPAQIRARNVAMLAGMTYLIATSIAHFVNTIVWAGNTRDVAPVWCDISSTIWYISQYGIEGTALCVCRHLERITSFRSAETSKRGRVVFEVLVTCVLPVLAIPLRYSLSSNRYMIMEDFGCLPAIWPSKLSMALSFGPQLLFAFGILVFSSMSLVNLFRFRHYRTAATGEARSVLGRAHFIRLLLFFTVVSIFAPVVISLLFYYGLELALLPWPGWKLVHAHFSHPLRLPTRFQPRALKQLQTFAFWTYAATAFIAFFSLISGQEVSNDCRRTWNFVRDRLLPRRHPASLASTSDEPLFRSSASADQTRVIVIGYDDDAQAEKMHDAHISFAEP